MGVNLATRFRFMEVPMRLLVPALIVAITCAADHSSAAEVSTADALRQIDPQLLGQSAAEAREVVRQDARNRLRAANQRETADWRKVESLADWQLFRDGRIAALRRSL